MSESRKLVGDYSPEALAALVADLYDPPSWLTNAERRKQADDFFLLTASLNLMESIAVLWGEGALGAGVIYLMWGQSFVSASRKWEQTIALMRRNPRGGHPGIYENFEELGALMSRRLRKEAERGEVERRIRRRVRRAWKRLF